MNDVEELHFHVLTSVGERHICSSVNGQCVLPAAPLMPQERQVFANMPAETRMDAGMP